MRKQNVLLSIAVLGALALGACGDTPNPGNAEDRSDLHRETSSAINDFKTADPSLDRFFTSAHAYVVFPEVVTGAIGIGGAHGNGQVFQNGKFIGYADVSQASIGAQLGGQKYAEVIFFENEGTFVDFENSTTAFDARATAIAASAGTAATANYERGVAVFTLPLGGLMAQASVGGQKFRFTPANGYTYTRSSTTTPPANP